MGGMGQAAPRTGLSEQEYLAFERSSPEKHEFADDEIFAMSGGTAEHSAVTLNLLAELRSALAGRGCRAFESNMRVQVPATGRYVYPDGRVGAASGESSRRVHVPERTGLPPDRSSAATPGPRSTMRSCMR